MLVLLACNSASNTRSEEGFRAYVGDKENGLIRHQDSKKMRFMAKHLPPDLLALNELRGGSSNLSKLDSISRTYAEGFTFILTLDAEDENGRLMFDNLSSFQEYKERVYAYNFAIDDYIFLKADGREYKPILSRFLDSQDIVNQLSFYLVFADDSLNTDVSQMADKLDLVFVDKDFNTGIHRFPFFKEDFQNIPRLNISNKSGV